METKRRKYIAILDFADTLRRLGIMTDMHYEEIRTKSLLRLFNGKL